MSAGAAMTHPIPTRQRRRLPYHTDAEMLELDARQGINASMLPSNQSAWSDALDGVHGLAHTPEQDHRGWTAQQPFDHVDCPVTHACVLCAKAVDPDFLRDHICEVALELAHD